MRSRSAKSGNTGNRFNPPAGHFPKIKEDDPPYRLLCNKYPAAKKAHTRKGIVPNSSVFYREYFKSQKQCLRAEERVGVCL
ncbi:MAG: D-lyxose/D-mannose family sugar isomerase [Oscillospiraceae bacterium]